MTKALLPALLLLATSAHAADAYIGIGGGVAKVDGFGADELVAAFDDGSFTSGSTNDSDTAYKLFGGAQFNRIVAIEATVTNLGKFEGEATSSGGIFYMAGPVDYVVKGWAGSFAIKGIAPINEQFSLFGKLGVARWETKERLTNGGSPRFGAEEGGSDSYFAIGASYAATDTLAIQLEIERYSDVLEYDVDVMGASLVYKFK